MHPLDSCKWLWQPHLNASGTRQMALDEALLTWAQQLHDAPLIVARTYSWARPTLSLGVHQKGKSERQAGQAYLTDETTDVVRRPTGGRAILHGEDVSFAFVTNHPALLAMSLNDSYCFFTKWIKQALLDCGVPLQTTCQTDTSDYMRSALCFQTQTPSDLLAEDGQKVCGSAQLRRQHGILQHGAAFVQPFGIAATQMDSALQSVITKELGQEPALFDLEAPTFQSLWQSLELNYASEAKSIRERLATTSGSHLVPASD